MPPKPVLFTTAALVVLFLLGFTAIKGQPDTASEWLAPIGPAVATAGAGLWLFDRYAWRWWGVHPLHARPILHGTWQGELVSDWVNETGERIPPDPNVFLVVRQRFWHVSVRLLTKESASVSTLADFKTDGDGVHQLVYVYGNTPRPEVRDRSKLHCGAVVLTAPRDAGHGIEGYYFTDRKTVGEMRFDRRFSELVESYSAALRLLGS
jgi:hypothetical protein